ncbi:MAG: hypothetical protein MUC87_11705 [Bacteroidia bacterium]|nr:hypothetical protein [Bacteroidia bacterium]
MYRSAPVFIAAWLLLFAGKTHAQDDRLFFHSLGACLFSGMLAPPAQYIHTDVNVYARPVQGQDPVFLRKETVTRLYADPGLIFFELTYNMRWNIAEPNRNSSISLSTSPSLGFSDFNSVGRKGHFTVPLFADLNFGNHATDDSNKQRGFHIGLGWQFLGAGLYKYKSKNRFISDYGTQFWMMPALRAGVRLKRWYFDLYLSMISTHTTTAGFVSEADLAGDFDVYDSGSKVLIDSLGEFTLLPPNSTYDDIFEIRRDDVEKVRSSYSFRFVFGFYLADGLGKKRRKIREAPKLKAEQYAFYLTSPYTEE